MEAKGNVASAPPPRTMGLGMPYAEAGAVKTPWAPPPRAYPIKGKTGRLVFLTAPSGMGKTATAHCLHQNHDFIFYEGDCFLGGAEPFPAQSPEGPFGAHWFGGRGTLLLPDLGQDRIDKSKAYFGAITKDFATNGTLCLVVPEDVERAVLSLLCDDVRKHFTALNGGYDMVVTCVVYSRASRRFMQDRLADLGMTWVVMNGNEELNKARILNREFETLKKMKARQREEARQSKEKEAAGNVQQEPEDEKSAAERKKKEEEEDAAAITAEVQHRLEGWEPFCNDKEAEPCTVGIDLGDGSKSKEEVAKLIVEALSAETTQ